MVHCAYHVHCTYQVRGADEWFDLDQRSILPAPLAASLPGFQFAMKGPCSRYVDYILTTY